MMLGLNHLYFTIPAFLIVGTSFALWMRALRQVAIPNDRTPYIASWVVGGTLGLIALAISESGDLTRIPAWFAISTATIFLFTVAISKQRLGDKAIRVGDRIPRFSATDEYGQRFDSQSVQGSLLLIKFFRAHW